MIKTGYWQDVVALYNQGKEKAALSDALRDLLARLEDGYPLAEKVFYQPELISQLIKVEEGKAKITTSTLKHYVDKELIQKVDSKTPYQLHDRLAIIYTQLTGYNNPRASMDQKMLEDKLKEIHEKHTWPRLIENEGIKKKVVDNVEDDYKIVTNLIGGTSSSKNTFLFTCAIFGIKPAQLKVYFEDYKNKKNKENNRPLAFQWKRLVGFIAIALFIGLLVWIYFFFTRPTPLKIRDKLPIDSFFHAPSDIDGQLPSADSIGIHTTGLSYERAMVQGDTIPIDRFWIRLIIYNLSDSLTFFPDGLFMEPVLVEKFRSDNVVEKKVVRSENQNAIILPKRLDRLFEWQLISEKDFHIPPRHFTHGLLKVERHERNEAGIFHFHLSLDGYNNQSTSLKGTSGLLKLALE